MSPILSKKDELSIMMDLTWALTEMVNGSSGESRTYAFLDGNVSIYRKGQSEWAHFEAFGREIYAPVRELLKLIQPTIEAYKEHLEEQL